MIWQWKIFRHAIAAAFLAGSFALPSGQAANAGSVTFIAQGTFVSSPSQVLSGWLTIDETAGLVTQADLNVPGFADFTIPEPNLVSPTLITVSNGFHVLFIFTAIPLTSFDLSVVPIIDGGICGPLACNAFLLTGSLTPGDVPLPTALPLFATGLGALGLLGWRRKRKQAA